MRRWVVHGPLSFVSSGRYRPDRWLLPRRRGRWLHPGGQPIGPLGGTREHPSHAVGRRRQRRGKGAGRCRGRRVAEARSAFLTDDNVEPGVVRAPILASWTRSRNFQVPVDHLDLPYETEFDIDSLLRRAAGPILTETSDQLATEPVSVILCDDEGVVLDRRSGDSKLNQGLDRIWLAPGFSYAERYVGTNGIGTAWRVGGPRTGVRPRALRRAPRGLRLRGCPRSGTRSAASSSASST